MDINSKGFRLLILVSICLLLSDWLPAHFKLWFVQETGHVSHDQTMNLLLILLLFRRWRHAITLGLFLSGLQLLFTALILFFNWKEGGPLLGYSLQLLLLWVVVKVLNDSTSVREFMQREQPV
ncbi:hypothetical protein [Hymenobacter negativus]|uniref:Uncharacterized protein n=1 Tax=Hymenobacter negativus TaxID=2795026 RepID=A0ABS3QEX8_9BACT|nr:hypothetical protein [Hymenobacter negativus]MBO2009806.1 hypothetical protein [Hymenobacter negativus]